MTRRRGDDNDGEWLMRLSDDQRRELFRRGELLERWEQARAEGKANGRDERVVTDAYLAFLSAIGVEVSRSTLFNWRRALRKDGLRGLADQRGGNGGGRDYTAFLAAVERLYRGPGLLTKEVCFELARREAGTHGWAVPTYRHVQRYLKAHVIPELTRERGMD